MRSRTTALLATICLALLGPLAMSGQETEGNEMQLATGRKYTKWFFDGNLEELHKKFSSQMVAAMNVEKLAAFRQQVEAQIGAEAELVEEETAEQDGFKIYIRRAKYANTSDTLIQTMWAFDETGMNGGFYVRPEEQP